MTLLAGPVGPSRFGRAREALSDVLIVTALVWVPVLIAGGLWAVVRMFL